MTSAASPLPSVIYVGAADYDVRLKKDKEMDRGRLLGETDSENSTIEINKKQSKCSMQNTLLHETLHAIFWTSGYNRNWPMDEEEKVVQALTPWLLAFLQDNPLALAYLLEK